MSSQAQLFKMLQAYDFALAETQLFLDTHPTNQKALEYFNRVNQLRQTAYAEYGDKFGPIVVSQADDLEKWQWIESPWPWERSED